MVRNDGAPSPWQRPEKSAAVAWKLYSTLGKLEPWRRGANESRPLPVSLDWKMDFIVGLSDEMHSASSLDSKVLRVVRAPIAMPVPPRFTKSQLIDP